MYESLKKEMIGKKFGLLTVLNEIKERNKHGHIMYEVVCECGNKKEVLGSSLRNGKSRACSKCKHKLTGTHGMWKSEEFNIWGSMIFRCDEKNKEVEAYSRYAGRGIKVCKEWKNSFKVFYTDMGKRPSKKHTIDRIDVNKGYYKENCRWALPKTQARNRTNNRIIEYNGVYKCIAEWCEILNMATSTFYNRLERGWDVERIFKTPVRKGNYSKKNIHNKDV